MMKKLLFVFVLGILSSWTINAQDITFSWDGNDLADTVHIYHEGEPEELIFHAILTNNTAQDINLWAVRVNTQVLDSTSNYFCWKDLCYPPFTDTSNVMLTIAAGASCTDGDFKTGYSYLTSFGNEVVGSSYVRYKFYDDANPDIYGEIVAHYEFGHVGIDDNLAESAQLLNIYPNPSNSFFNIEYHVGGQGQAVLQLHNVLGVMVKENEIAGEGLLNIDVTDLEQGVYFCSIVSQGKVHGTKRLVVQK